MLNEISHEIRNILNSTTPGDKLIFNNQLISLHNNFQPIIPLSKDTIAFIDGGQAEILSSGNFNLSFIRVSALVLNHHVKKQIKKEFFLLTTAKYINNEIHYVSKIFGDKIIDETDLFISSKDATIKTGLERAPISKVVNIARRFAELSLASQTMADFVLLDGTLEKSYQNEEKYFEKLTPNVCSLAKSSSLLTTSGNSPVVLMNKLGPVGCWQYSINNKTFFVKLHPKAKHVFRFEGNLDILSSLADNSKDALFLGYPYGLIFSDRIARVSNNEKNSLKARFMLNKENKEIMNYLTNTNAHDILDNIS